MPRPSRRAIVLVCLSVATVLGALFIWPTMYWYDHPCGRLVRINRFTGSARVLLDAGWAPLEKNPFDEAVRVAESERLGYWVVSALVCPSYR